MILNTEIQFWLASSMLLLGALVFLLGLWILSVPDNFLKVAQMMSKWISTDQYFDYMDRPRYQERFIYKHHHVAGVLIVLGAMYTLVMLSGDVDIKKLPVIINSFWSSWIYNSFYYLLIGANLLAVAAGIVVFIRPSLLKGVEGSLNKWISTGDNLKKLDETHEISLDILPGNPRLFGLAVMLGGLYIILSMAVVLL